MVCRLLLTCVTLLWLAAPAGAQLPAWEELPNTKLAAAVEAVPCGAGSINGIVGAWNMPAFP